MGSEARSCRAEVLLLPECLDDYVSAENPVRILDAYVNELNLAKLKFEVKADATVGRPCEYSPAVLLKLLIYGYLNQVRSSRKLEAETKRNLEVIWLIEKAQPDHWTINHFRRKNRNAFKQVLREFHRLCQKMELFGRELQAIDGSFFKARNSKANNFTRTKLDTLEAGIDAKIERAINDYERSLDGTDNDSGSGGNGGEGDENSDGEVEAKKAELTAKKQRISQLREQAKESASGQVSLVDRDSRLLKKGTQSVVGHNVQSVVDGQNNLIAHIEIVQAGNDSLQLEPMARAGCEALGITPSAQCPIDVIADSGYYNCAQMNRCEQTNMRVHVPAKATTAIKTPGYQTGDFTHDPLTDEYLCPQGNRLKRHADNTRKEITYATYYATAVCRECPVRGQCTKGKYRKLQISEYQDFERGIADRLAQSPEVYARRKGLVEHPFGTLKSIWGYRQFMVTGKEGCEGELNLMAFCYNWKRALKLVGFNAFMDAIKALTETLAAIYARFASLKSLPIRISAPNDNVLVKSVTQHK